MCAQNRLAIACDLQKICKVKHFSNKKFKICIKLFKILPYCGRSRRPLKSCLDFSKKWQNSLTIFRSSSGITPATYEKKIINRGNTRSGTGFYLTLGYEYTVH